MPVLRTPRYRGLVAGALIALAGVAAWATVQALLGSGTWSSDDGTALVYAPKRGEYAFAAAKPNDARRNQVFSGDAGALAAFETTHPLGAITALPASGDPVRGTFSPVVDWPLVAIHAERKVDAQGNSMESERIVGVSRYITNPDKSSCEFSLVVADDFNGKGLGSRLMLSIMEEARDKGLAEIEGLVLANNPGMLKLMKGLGFQIKPFAEDPDFKLVTHAL